jgi:hypothetical protein
MDARLIKLTKSSSNISLTSFISILACLEIEIRDDIDDKFGCYLRQNFIIKRIDAVSLPVGSEESMKSQLRSGDHSSTSNTIAA